MSELPQPSDCCSPCETPETVQIPGPQGSAGSDGDDGSNGVSAFSLTTGGFTVPAVGANVTISVSNSTWMVPGQVVFIQNAGYYEVVSKPTSTSVTVENLGYTGNAAPGTILGAAQLVSPSGIKGADGAFSGTIDDLSPTTTKGDLLVDDGGSSPNASLARLGVGANGTQLQADSTQALGVKWTKDLQADSILHGVDALAYAATVDLNMSGKTYKTLTLTGNVIFTTSNKASGRNVRIRVTADAGGPWTFTFPAWIFIGAAAPASIAASKTSILELHCFGAADTDILARYLVEP